MQKDLPIQIESTNGEKAEKISLKDFYAELGGSGTNASGGYIYDEYNSQLLGRNGIETYEKMRKSDGQVAATRLAMDLPIRATKWYVNPAKNEDGEIEEADIEIAKFVEDALFKKMETTWDEFLSQILTMLDFGHSVFEKVFYSDGEKIWIKKLGQRVATSIEKWQTLDGKPGIQQTLPSSIVRDGQTLTYISIPAAKLLVFTYRKEGTNYEGVSALRAAWKHWWIKDKLYRFDAIRHERQSMGMPIVYLPQGASSEDKDDMKAILKNYRVSEESFLLLPSPDWKVEFMDLKSGSNSNLMESIKHHNAMISNAMLAQFLNIVESQMGSRALSEDQSDLFVLGLTSIARLISDIINRYLIPELVDYNFTTDKYPELCFNKLGDIDYQKLATILSTLAGAELVKPDSALENYIRETMGLPAPLAEEETPEEEMAPDEEQDPGMMPEVDDAGNPIEPVDGETPDGEETAPGADQQSTLDDLNSELDSLEASDFDYESVVLDYLEEAEHYIESMSFVAKGGHLDEETKKKISEALKKRGGAARSVADTAVQKTKIVQDNFEKNVAPIRGEMDSIRKLRSSIPKGKKGTAQRAELKKRVDALREKINGLRSGKKDLLGKIKQGRMDALKTIKEVNAQLKARREMIRNTVNSIRAEMKQGGEKATANLMPLDDHIEKNREQADSLRAKLKSIPEGKEGKEQREAVRAAIKGLYDENRSIVKSKKQIRGELRTLRDTKRKEIDRVKSEFHEHHIEHDPIFSLVDNSFIIALQNECSPAEKAELKKKGLMFNVFEKQAPRPLTFAERRVNLAMMNKALDEFSSKLQEKLDEVQAWQKEDLIAQAKRAIEKNDIGAVATIATKYKGDLAGALTEAQKELFELGKQTASAEIQVPRPPTKSEVRGAMRIQNDVLVAEATAQMENTTKKTVIDMLRGYGGSITDATAPAIVKELQTVLDNKAQKLNNSLLTVNTTGALNLGRATIFEKHAEKIYAFQYSAILDRRTTDRCRSLDGRVVKPGSSEFFDYTPPQHMNCRSIWVEILVEDDFKPEVTGIPSSIPAVGNIENAQDLKAPIILKNSPAITQIKDELKERKEKLALLEADGKYPNRQAAHKSRIADLEKSLKGKFQEEVLANVKNRCYSQSDL